MEILLINNFDLRIRRFIAFLIDTILVIGIGAIVGFFFKPQLITLGNNTIFIGFTIALIYHGLFNSLLFSGQTIGKFITGLKVVSKSGKRISVFKSLFRSFLIIYVFFISNVNLPEYLDLILTFVFWPFFVAQLTYAIYSPGSRSAHDFLWGTYVVNSNSSSLNEYSLPFKPLKFIGIVSIILFSIWFILRLTSPKIDDTIAIKFKKTQTELMSFKNVKNIAVEFNGNKYIIKMQTIGPLSDCHKIATQAAYILINNMAISASKQEIQVIIARGYELIIYHEWEIYEKTFSKDEWEQQFSNLYKQ